jgi:hypothetical protein
LSIIIKFQYSGPTKIECEIIFIKETMLRPIMNARDTKERGLNYDDLLRK